MPNLSLRVHYLFFFLIAFVLGVMTSPAWAAKERPVALHLPAETLLPMLQKTLPWEIPVQGKQMQGEITVESLRHLSIKDDVVSIQGIFSGKNTSVNTQIAGQDIRLKIGQVRVSLHCDIHLRFDYKTQKLFLKPRFDRSSGDGQGAALKPLLSVLNDREFPVDLKKLLGKLRVPMGNRGIDLAMEAVKISGTDNALILHLQPEKSTVK